MASYGRRLRGYDYGSNGAYFVTICTDHRRSLFEDTDVAAVIRDYWTAIPQHFPRAGTDAFVIMPNHVHGIVLIGDPADAMPSVVAWHAKPLRKARGAQPGSLGAIIGSFKGAVSRELRLRRLAEGAIWQRNYYERVIRSEEELNRIREYIAINPIRWHLDNDNPHRTPDRQHDLDWGWLER